MPLEYILCFLLGMQTMLVLIWLLALLDKSSKEQTTTQVKGDES